VNTLHKGDDDDDDDKKFRKKHVKLLILRLML
jgi:hypothetical protein